MGRVFALTVHKPAHGHGHCHANRGPDFLFATEVTQGPLSSAHYTHTTAQNLAKMVIPESKDGGIVLWDCQPHGRI